jgi:asparagine synthase (glutamine-hydrolysing)
MCGICGIVGPPGSGEADPEKIRHMCRTILHRGPDDEGIHVHGPVGLGMRRLSIIDLVGGHQPIHNEDRSIWIVFNGEIYNFPELHERLLKRGHQFYTHSDTEVIVHLYEDLGADCVQQLRGMFAFALYDFRQDSLLLARDRLGKKPLYYALRNRCLLFGSEIKALLAVEPDLTKVEPAALLDFFSVGYIPDPKTAFAYIFKLPPGHVLEFRSGQVYVKRYWDLPTYGGKDPGSEEACLEELEQRLSEAVRIRLLSEVPLGALLSGGVDSSVVVALMARASGPTVKTFSIGFAEEDFSEAAHARAVAQTFGTEHREFTVEPELTETVELLTASMEEPFADSSIVPTYHVCRMARQHVTVVLSGDGGDELFAGYDRYLVHLGRQRYEWIPAWAGRLFRNHVYPWMPKATYGRRLMFNLSLNARDRYLDSISYLPAQGRERSLFSTEFLSKVQQVQPLEDFRRYFDEAPAQDPISRLLYLDTKTYLTADVLAKVDRMSMLNSLEVRCPLLDHVLVEWVAQLNSRWKLRFGQPKYLLRRLAERLGVPAGAIHRPKQGFAMPLTHWWRDQLKGGMLGILLEPRTLERGYFNPRAVRQLVEEHLSGRRNRPADIWLLLIFELWHRNFLSAANKTPSRGFEAAASSFAIGRRASEGANG